MTDGVDGSRGSDSTQQPDEPGSGTGSPADSPRPSRDGGENGGVGRRQLLIGGGAAVGFWYLFLRDDSDSERNDPAVGSAEDDGSADGGYSDPGAAVIAFVERVQNGEDDAATELLHGDEYESARDLLGNWYDDYAGGEFVNMQTNVRSEEPDSVEIEFLYNDNNHHDPGYGFGSLFYLREVSRGWEISDFDGSHMGEAWG